MNDIIARASRHSFDETMARLTKAIADGGNTLFADIDQSAAANSVGLRLRPTRLLLFGNPKGGTPVMEAFPVAALDLPLKIVVWEENGTTMLAYYDGATIAARYNVTGKDAQIAGMTQALASIVASLD